MDDAKFELLWQLNPNGSREKIYSDLKIFLSKDIILPSGEKLTFDTFYLLYKNYIEFMEDKQAGKYTKSQYEIKTIDKFIEEGIYRQSFKPPRRMRDVYLFGDFTDKDLKMKLRTFIVKHERPKPKSES